MSDTATLDTPAPAALGNTAPAPRSAPSVAPAGRVFEVDCTLSYPVNGPTDFAHLGVTFCRALNIPARRVVGYAPFEQPPPDFHAVFEAYLGDRWVLFDATRMSPLDQMVRIATGPDARDVAFATFFGPATMTAMNPLIRPAG